MTCQPDTMHVLDSLFNGAPKVPAPWPLHGRLRHRPRVLPSDIDAVLATPATLVEVDPRTLAASQPWILAEHVGYYLGDEWQVTGRTSADQWAPMNRFPLVLPDHQGRLTIVAGHHRAAAAMLRNQPLLARVAPGSWEAPAALTPTLYLDASDDSGTAEVELRRRGLTDDEIRFALMLARPGRGA